MIIPAESMKGREGQTSAFHVTLSVEAIRVLDDLKKFERDGFVFPRVTKGIMSDMTMTNYIKDRGHEFRPHGFRSSFRTWCADATDVPRDVAETTLAHSTGSKVERSYRRTDFFERRKVLMEQWANFVVGNSGNHLKLGSVI